MAAYLEHFLHAYGYVAVFGIIAFENIGLPVPGETILITAAIFAGTTHELNIVAVVMTATVAAFAGSAAGWTVGRYGERHFLHRYGRYLHIDDSDLRLGRYLFGRYGGRVVFVARFIAFLRALAGLLAGINGMPWRRFLLFSGLGAAAWAATFGFGAYLLGDRLEALSSRAALLVSIAVVAMAIAGFRFLRLNRARLQREADRADRAA
jgi:membrane protein DedA with SNARE-associated domain